VIVDATLTGSRAAAEPDPPATSVRGHDRGAHVALLAATAIGLVFVSGGVDGDVHTLVGLAHLDGTVLLEASAAVASLEVGSERTRARAADLLRRAAQRIAGVGQLRRSAR
jgi:hypothetical protein